MRSSIATRRPDDRLGAIEHGKLCGRVVRSVVLGLEHASQVLDLEKGPDLSQAQPDVLTQALDELQSLEIGLIVAPVRASATLSRLEETELLVVADRALRESGRFGSISDPQHCYGL